MMTPTNTAASFRAPTLAAIAGVSWLGAGLGAGLALSLAGCNTSEGVAQDVGGVADAVGGAFSQGVSIDKLVGRYNLSSLAGTDLTSLLAGGAQQPTMEIANDGKIGGVSGLNRYTTRVDVPQLLKGNFRLSEAAGTKMLGPTAGTELETAFFAMLEKVRSFKLDGGTLTLLDEAKKAIATFTKIG